MIAFGLNTCGGGGLVAFELNTVCDPLFAFDGDGALVQACSHVRGYVEGESELFGYLCRSSALDGFVAGESCTTGWLGFRTSVDDVVPFAVGVSEIGSVCAVSASFCEVAIESRFVDVCSPATVVESESSSSKVVGEACVSSRLCGEVFSKVVVNV